MIRISPRWAAAALASVFLAGPLHAQWLLEVAAGGVAHEMAGATPATSTNSLAFTLRHEGRRWLYATSGLPVDAEAPPWLAAGGGGRELVLRAGPTLLGVDWSGHAHGYRVDGVGTGGGFTAGALPFVQAGFGPMTMEVRSGAVHYFTAVAGESTARTAHDSGVTAAFRSHPALTVAADARLLRSGGDAYPYLGLSGELELGSGSLWAFGGAWRHEVLTDPAWGAGATLALGERTHVRVSVQQDATDPLYWNETRRFWSVGLSRRLGPTRASPLSVPVMPEIAGGRVVFRIPSGTAATAPSVAGDFNGWTPVPMRREGEFWLATLRVRPGVYQYAFRGPDGKWFVPDTVPNRVDDGFGGTNAVLVVPARDGR